MSTLRALRIPADVDKPLELATIGYHLASFQAEVGDGYIEAVSPIHYAEHRDWLIWCNEDGKNLGLPVNARATGIACLLGWSAAGHDVIVGDAILIGVDGPNNTDCPTHVLDLLARLDEPVQVTA